MRAPRLSIGLGSFLVALALVVAVGIGSAIAVIPNQGTYYACLVKKTGAIKVINYPKAKCAKGTQLIKWSQRGPAGPQGAAGPADWSAIPNIPAGFADGTDNEGVTAVKIKTVTSDTPTVLTPGSGGSDSADCPPGFLVVGGGYFSPLRVEATVNNASDADTWTVSVINTGQGQTSVAAQAICLRAEPAGLTVAAKNSDFGPKKAHVRKGK